MEKYLSVTVKPFNGGSFYNPLKLSESSVIIKLAKENKEVIVSVVECTKAYYKTIFG